MPLTLPDRLPAIDLLKKENIFVMGTSRATTQDIRPLRIVVLNLMPIKITTETDLIRVLSNTPLQLELTFMKIKSHTSKNTPVEHMRAFYHDFEVLRNRSVNIHNSGSQSVTLVGLENGLAGCQAVILDDVEALPMHGFRQDAGHFFRQDERPAGQVFRHFI